LLTKTRWFVTKADTAYGEGNLRVRVDVDIRSTDSDAPLRLDIAAKIAFPDGTMGAAGLRKERDKGHLVTELIAGKEYVTLAAIAAMRKICREQRKARASSGVMKAEKQTVPCAAGPAGSSATAQPSSALAAALATANALKNGSPVTSPKSTSRSASGVAIQLPSQ
jgi:hypothetical protein